MKDTQENKLSMYNAVKRVLNMFKTRWEALAGFSMAVSSFSNKLTALETNASLQKRKITGIAIDKKDLKETLSDYAYMVAGAVHAYAQSTGNDELRKSVDFVRSDFTLMRDDIIDKECRNIHTAATTHLANLGGYGITEAILDTLMDLIKKYQEKSPQVRTAISARATYTEAIDTLEADIDLILEGELDKMMPQFKNTDAGATPSPSPSGSPTGATPSPAPAPSTDFYELYFQAREIIDLGKRTFHQLEFELKPDEAIKISNVVSEKPAKNTGHTTLTWRDMDNDEPRIIEPGQVVFIFTPGGNVEIKNTDNASPGKIMVTVYKRDAFERE